MDIENYKKLRNRAKDISTFIDNQPLRINVINYAARGKLKEIAHSMILSGLLCDNEILYSFLNNFMPSSEDFALRVPPFHSRGTVRLTLMVPSISERWYWYQASEMSAVKRCSITDVA